MSHRALGSCSSSVSSDDSPDLVVVAGRTLPDLHLLPIGGNAVSEIQAFVLARPNDLILTICGELLVGIIVAARPDLHLGAASVHTIGNVKAERGEDAKRGARLCPRLSGGAVAVLDGHVRAIRLGHRVEAFGRAHMRVNDVAGDRRRRTCRGCGRRRLRRRGRRCNRPACDCRESTAIGRRGCRVSRRRWVLPLVKGAGAIHPSRKVVITAAGLEDTAVVVTRHVPEATFDIVDVGTEISCAGPAVAGAETEEASADERGPFMILQPLAKAIAVD